MIERILIIGAGAMGTLFARGLAASGKSVTLLDRKQAFVDAVNRRGARVEEPDGPLVEKSVKAVLSGGAFGPQDLAIFAVKAYDTLEAAEEIAPKLSKNEPVLTLQNGLGNIEALSKVFSGRRVLGGVTSHGANVVGPGRVRHAGSGYTIIGEAAGKPRERTHEIAKMLSEAGFETTVAFDLRSVVWGKLIVNAGINAVASILRVKNGFVAENPEARCIVESAVAEAVQAAAAKGINLPFANPAAHVLKVAENTGENINSMLQDLSRGKRTEIDAINGAIADAAKKNGKLALVNEMLWLLIKAAEQTSRVEIESEQGAVR
jgi:2-dehydropantoate 2-reductase